MTTVNEFCDLCHSRRQPLPGNLYSQFDSSFQLILQWKRTALPAAHNEDLDFYTEK